MIFILSFTIIEERNINSINQNNTWASTKYLIYADILIPGNIGPTTNSHIKLRQYYAGPFRSSQKK